MPSFVSRDVILLDEMPSFVSHEVNLLDEMPSFVSREVPLLDEINGDALGVHSVISQAFYRLKWSRRKQ